VSTFSTILAAILGVVFVGVGIPKVTGQEQMVENFRRWGYADVIRQAVGWVEVLAGTLILTGIAIQSLAVTGSLVLVPLMLGALATHQHAHDPLKLWIPPAVLLVIDLVFAYSLLP
jgi:putative oxidoreductase